MSRDDHDKGGAYEVGYGKPPKQHRFRPGQSGNPSGRPKAKKSETVDISALLNEPIKVKAGGNVRGMALFEAMVRQLAKRALNNEIRAIIRFIRLCEEHGAIAPPVDRRGGVIIAPRGVDFEEWLESVTEVVETEAP